jgi:hypothetical protein
MKFDDIVKQILEDYNYSYNSGNYQTGTVQASSKEGILNTLRPFDGSMGGANQPIGRGMFPQKKDYTTKNKNKLKKLERKLKNKNK